MPYRRNGRPKKNKRYKPVTRHRVRATVKSRYIKPRVLRQQTLSLFPRRLFTKFNYAEDFQLTNTLAQTPVHYVFRANSLYDPNLTGVGGQPRYYDTLLGNTSTYGPYQRWVVLGAKITLTIFSRANSVTSSPAYNGYVSIRAAPLSGELPSSVEEMNEGTFMTRIAVTNSQSNMPRKLSYYIPMKKFYGCNDVMDDLLSYGGTWNTNPVTGAYFIVSMCPIGATDTGASFDFMANIKYYAMLYQTNDVLDS